MRRENSCLPALCAASPLYHTSFHFLFADAEQNKFAQSCPNQKAMITCNEQIENRVISTESRLTLIYAAELLVN